MPKSRGSTKVPGVKLKAVPSNASSKRRIEDSYSDNEEHDPLGETSTNDTKPPLDGLVLCCTGIKDKTVLFEQAKILGATTSKDFTVTVTHLIADGSGSAKYQCALERSIPIMSSKWVADTYTRWQNGEIVTLKETIERHRLPSFIGLRVAITGENDAANDSEKVKWAKGANAERKKSGLQTVIQMVWEEWLLDSIDWKGKWDEANYRIESPRPSRKIPPELQAEEAPFFDPPSFLGCATSTQRPTGSSSLHKSSADPGPSRLAQSSGSTRETLTVNGEEQPEIAQIRRDHPTRPKDVLGNRLWADIVFDAKAGSSDSKGKGKAVARPRRIAAGDETEDEDDVGGEPPVAGSANNGDGEVAQRPSYLAKMKSSRELAFAAPSNTVRRPPQTKATGRLAADLTGEVKVFAGLKFRTFGQAARDVAVKALEDNGGTVIRDADEKMDEIDYVIVRLHDREGAKYDKALTWNVEVVDLDWLWAIARTGRIEGETVETEDAKQQSPITDITNTSPSETGSRKSDPKTEEDNALKPSSSKATLLEPTSIPPRLLSVSPSKRLAVSIPSPSAAQSPNPPSASSSSAQLGSAIAAMLGKRSSGEQEQDAEPPKKKSKRPARSRTMADGTRLSASVSPARLGTSFVPPIHTMPETAFDELQEELGPDSMLVSYEDPAQKAQKMKIMALIKGETAPQLPVAVEDERRRRLPRKSRKAVSGA
ncbi:hypothetical protein FRC05_004015 [Tulasnella sp. 425]|nr:hypothetical protein FRC05_004015 [Tulasnella sp. 425]